MSASYFFRSHPPLIELLRLGLVTTVPLAPLQGVRALGIDMGGAPEGSE